MRLVQQVFCVRLVFSCASYSKPLGFVLYVLPRCPWQANQIHCTGLSIQIHDFDVLNHIIYDCIQSNYSGIFVVHTCTIPHIMKWLLNVKEMYIFVLVKTHLYSKRYLKWDLLCLKLEFQSTSLLVIIQIILQIQI